MRYRSKSKFPLGPVLGALFMGAAVAGSALWSANQTTWPGPLFQQLQDLTRLEPVRVFPRTTRVLAARDARTALVSGHPWEAWALVRDEVFDRGATPDFVLLGARAAAGWGGWTNVRSLLEDRDWLGDVEAGEGYLLLARAEEELGDEEAAAAAYRRYLAVPGAKQRGVAYARLAGQLRVAKNPAAAAEAYGNAAKELPDIEDWMLALQLEQAVAAGTRSPAPPGQLASAAGVAARAKRVEAEARGWVAAGDPARAISRLEVEERVLRGQDGAAEAAQLRLARAQLLLEANRSAEARELLRMTAAENGILVDTRLTATRLLGEMSDRSAQEQLAMAAAYEAGKKPGPAARELRVAIRQLGASNDAAMQMRLGRLLYDAVDLGPARVAFLRAAELLSDPEQVAEAQLYAARSVYRAGGNRKFDSIAELKRIVERYPETAAAGSASLLLGDLSSKLETARGHYRRAAAVRTSPDAREALYRVGDRSLKLKDTAGAIRAWEDYVERYPTGDATARVAYETGKLHERAGRASRARAMYTAAVLAEPTSYFAMRAGDKLGVSPLDRVLAEPRPWLGLASEPEAAAIVLRRLDALKEVGLEAEWEAEYLSATRTLANRPAAIISLAEGVRDRGYSVKAINLGWQLWETRGREWDVRLLRVVFPFIYRETVVREAERKGIDPYLLAGLVRQESSFRHDARSRVGATGLGQIMPSTGEWLAPLAGIRSFDRSLLEVPEINLRMAAEYLEDLLERYDGAEDLALAGYNAGPSRADRWRRQLPTRDRDVFRDAIPFTETRDYIKLVLRNAEMYERLYGGR